MPLISLPSKPGAPIAYTLWGQGGRNEHEAGSDHALLVVFLNGLGLPAKSWIPAVDLMRASGRLPLPPMLTYDRFGQGETTARDPADSRPGRDAGYGHDFLDVVHDLHELVAAVARQHSLAGSDGQLRLVLVAASIGVHLARLYAQQHPGTVAGLLSLDSNIGSKEFSDLWPDPEAVTSNPALVISDDCTLEQYLRATNRLGQMFDSHVKNAEGLDRRSLKLLLPQPGEPKLEGPGGKGPWLTVVGHDPEAFAEESYRTLEVPRSLSLRFVQSAWGEYNEGLLQLTDVGRARGVVIASGCGHFVQRDDPQFVAAELSSMLDRVSEA